MPGTKQRRAYMDSDFLMPFEFQRGDRFGQGGRQLHRLDRSDFHRRARRSRTDARPVDLAAVNHATLAAPPLMWQFPQPGFWFLPCRFHGPGKTRGDFHSSNHTLAVCVSSSLLDRNDGRASGAANSGNRERPVGERPDAARARPLHPHRRLSWLPRSPRQARTSVWLLRFGRAQLCTWRSRAHCHVLLLC